MLALFFFLFDVCKLVQEFIKQIANTTYTATWPAATRNNNDRDDADTDTDTDPNKIKKEKTEST